VWRLADESIGSEFSGFTFWTITLNLAPGFIEVWQPFNRLQPSVPVLSSQIGSASFLTM